MATQSISLLSFTPIILVSLECFKSNQEDASLLAESIYLSRVGEGSRAKGPSSDFLRFRFIAHLKRLILVTSD